MPVGETCDAVLLFVFAQCFSYINPVHGFHVTLHESGMLLLLGVRVGDMYVLWCGISHFK